MKWNKFLIVMIQMEKFENTQNIFLHTDAELMKSQISNSLGVMTLRNQFSIEKDEHHENIRKQRKDSVYALSKKRLCEDKSNEKVINLNKKNKLNMKIILRKQKVKALTNNFRAKIKRNNVYQQPIQFKPIQSEEGTENLNQIDGLLLPKRIVCIFSICYLLQFLLSFFFYGIGLVFQQEIEQVQFFQNFKKFTVVVAAVEIIMNSICQKIIGDKKITKIAHIFRSYSKKKFFLDLFCFTIFLVDACSSIDEMKILRLCLFVKVKTILQKISSIEDFLSMNWEKEQYWSLIKLFILNFLMAHVVAIILLSIAHGEENWMKTANYEHREWNQQYAFAYFIAMSTMLGFGNATPSNYFQSIFISILQCFSCMLFAYIINSVGNLITNLAKQNEKTENSLRISKRLAEENNISQELESKISNYVRQTNEIEKNFNFKSETNFLSSLPEDMKNEFFKESNRKLFNNLPFFKSMTEKTMINLAEIIETRICHPEQIIFNKKKPFKFMILKKGRVGYYPDKSSDKLNKILFNQIEVKETDNPQLLSLNIFNQDYKDPVYFIKSIDFSIIYDLDLQSTIQTLKTSPYDYEKFCQLRDSSKHILDQFEIVKCETCNSNHTKAKCSRLHYLPLKSLVIYKHLEVCKLSKNVRSKYERKKLSNKYNPMFLHSTFFLEISEIVLTNSVKNIIELEEEKRKFTQKYNMASKIQKTLSFWREESFEEFKNRDYLNLMKLVKNLQTVLNDLLLSKNSEAKSQFWKIETDELHNWSYYFTNCNPHCFKNRLLKRESHGTFLPKKKKNEKVTKFKEIEEFYQVCADKQIKL